MRKQKAQSSMEYLMITAFMLVIIVIIFTLSLITTDQNIKTRQKSDSLERLVQTADLVYAMGKGNVLFAEVNWPNGVTGIETSQICKTSAELPGCPATAGPVTGCEAGQAAPCGCACTAQPNGCSSEIDCIKYSAVKVASDDAASDLIYASKARLEIVRTSWCPGPNQEPFLLTGENYEIKVSAMDTGIIQLERYCG